MLSFVGEEQFIYRKVIFTIQLEEYLEIEHISVTTGQIKKWRISRPLEALSRPLPVPPPPTQA